MAYARRRATRGGSARKTRGSRGTTYAARGARRSTGRTRRVGYTRRASGSNRRASSPRSIRIVIEQAPASPVARPGVSTMATPEGPKPKKAQF